MTSRSILRGLVPLLLFFALLAGVAAAETLGSRTFEFVYEATVGPVEAGRGPVHVFLPLPAEGPGQRVIALEVDAAIPGAIETEPVYGNRFWHGVAAASDGEPIRAVVRARVERDVVRQAAPAGPVPALDASERESLRRFLEPNERVVVGHEMLDPILAEVHEQAYSQDRAAVALAIYEWVVDNVEYKKVGSGWGNGDTFWACSERFGNCTDFHSLFISLARTEGIPARFEMGFPIPEGEVGEIGGYHCWVHFYLPGTGWFPIDASEAFKNPEKRALFYGTHPADRILFTTGRDLRLGPDHRDGALNYFIYPYVEVAGRTYQGPVGKRFSYRELPAEPASSE